MKINLFGLKITVGNRALEEVFAGLFKAEVGKDAAPDHLEINRACVITAFGRKFAVDVTFRRITK